MRSTSGDTAFFHDQAVHRAIDRLASVKSVLIFAGAGVTIDKTGMSWGRLMEQVISTKETLTERHHLRQGDGRFVAEHLAPIELASIASRYYRKLDSNDADTRSSLRAKIVDLLYRGDEWQSGTLARNLVRLATAWTDHRVEVSIATTNYDIYLEQEFEKQKGLREGLVLGYEAFPSVSVYAIDEFVRDIEGGARSSGNVKLVYLHGRLARGGEVAVGQTAITESDYHNLRPAVTQKLQTMLGDAGGLLILGSSLTDPPLLSALHDTKDTAKSKPRIALMPVGSFLTPRTTESDVLRLKPFLRERASSFGVKLLIPHFFSQTAQFCEELITDLKHRTAGGVGYAHDASIRYSRRIEEWWRQWEANHIHDTKAPDLAYRLLTRQLDDILHSLELDGDPDDDGEKLKLEVWARWRPQDRSREIGLWCMTTGVRKDFQSVRRAHIEIGSRYQAVESLITGRPRLVSPDADAEPDGLYRSEQWRTFLSVPIEVDMEWGPVPVGVVTLASTKAGNESAIATGDAEEAATMVDNLKLCGGALLSTGKVPQRLSRT